MATAVRIVKVLGPAIALSAGHKAQTFIVREEVTGTIDSLHVEVLDADADDKDAWQTALEAIAPLYNVVDW